MIRPLAGFTLALLALGFAPAAWADDEAPVATANAGPGGFTLDDQIAAWRAAGEASPSVDPSTALVPAPQRDRQPHGVVSVGIGTGGYRSVYGQTDLPVGRTGTLSLAVGDEQGRVFGREVHARSLAIGLSFDARAAAPACPPALAPRDAPWRRYDAFEMQRLQAACDAAQP